MRARATKLALYTGHDAENEALFIADTIEKVLGQHPEWRVAVLYRTNFQSRQIEEALRRYRRNYLVVGGFSFYQRAEVKDIVAYLKVAVSRVDRVSLLRVINTPARGIGRSTVEQIEAYASERNISLWDALVKMLDEDQFGTRAHASIAAFRNIIEELAEAVEKLPLNEALAVHRGAHRLSQDAGAGEHARSGSAPRKPGGNRQRRGRKHGSAARRRRTFWITPRWWPTPIRWMKKPR